MTSRKWKHGIVLILVVLLSLFFAVAGGSKLINAERHADNFERWGYPSWFVLVTGLAELLGAGILLLPRLRIYGIVVLGGTLLGAALTHLQANEMAAVPVPLSLVLALAIVGLLTWNKSG